jgi:hypothetical protein
LPMKSMLRVKTGYENHCVQEKQLVPQLLYFGESL